MKLFVRSINCSTIVVSVSHLLPFCRIRSLGRGKLGPLIWYPNANSVGDAQDLGFSSTNIHQPSKQTASFLRYQILIVPPQVYWFLVTVRSFSESPLLCFLIYVIRFQNYFNPTNLNYQVWSLCVSSFHFPSIPYPLTGWSSVASVARGTTVSH